MKRILALLFVSLLVASAPVPPPHWSRAQVERLIAWMTIAEAEGLGAVTVEVPAVQRALDDGDDAQLDTIATAAAIRLLTAHRSGCCNAALRTGWHISDDQAWPEAGAAINSAVTLDRLDALYAATRPSHPFYIGLSQAYQQEQEASRRATLAANLDRWRWMPRALGGRYLLVNTAAFEATLWQDDKMVGRWAVIVGKTKSPTPVFQAQVTGVNFNPWWEIPSSIAAESVAGMIARNPREAARRGYVLQNGRYRQRPGPTNALGRMKLVMPNGFSVYLHDTPAQALFTQDLRAYSHGCVRVGDALGLATALLSPQGWDRARVDALVASNRTQTISLAAAIPVYIGYFTAEPDGLGGVRYFRDIYHRDRGAAFPDNQGLCNR